MRNLADYISCCDNGTEFRGAVKAICTQNNVRMVRGRAYHPQSQGSIEIANRTFKNRLRSFMTSTGRKDWHRLLNIVAFRINTTQSAALPNRKTPYDVWFGRTRRWVYEPQLDNDETEVEESEDETAPAAEDDAAAPDNQQVIEIEDDGEAAVAEVPQTVPTAVVAEPAVTQDVEEHSELSDINFFAGEDDLADEEGSTAEQENAIAADDAAAEHEEVGDMAEEQEEEDAGFPTELSEIEVEVAANNARLHKAMKAKGNPISKSFMAQELATLFIPTKLRLKTENTRLVVRIIDENCAGYRLLSRQVITSLSRRYAN